MVKCRVKIKAEVLKIFHAVIHKELRDLFNAFLRYGSFPGTWKEGSIRAPLKDPDRDVSDPASYCPICLLLVIEKYLKKLLAERLRSTVDAQPRTNSDSEGEDRQQTQSWKWEK